jgi:uncharacterized membrane protein
MPIPLTLLGLAVTAIVARIIIIGFSTGTTAGHPIIQFNRFDRPIMFWFMQLSWIFAFLLFLWPTVGGLIDFFYRFHR